jgi:hypothetical protein
MIKTKELITTRDHKPYAGELVILDHHHFHTDAGPRVLPASREINA